MLRNYLQGNDYIRIIQQGPNNLAEAIWYYLYREGLIRVPVSWHWAAFRSEIGVVVLKLLKPIVDWLIHCRDGRETA